MSKKKDTFANQDQLMRQIKSGDRAAWEKLFPILLPQLLPVARHVGRRVRADPEDIIHEAMIRLLRLSPDRLPATFQGLRAIALVIVQRLVIDTMRRQQRSFALDELDIVEAPKARKEMVSKHKKGPSARENRPATPRATLASLTIPPAVAPLPEFAYVLQALGDLYRAHGGDGLQIAEPENWQAFIATTEGAP